MSESKDPADLLDEVKNELSQIDDLAVGEHAGRLEGIHKKLETALSTIDGL